MFISIKQFLVFFSVLLNTVSGTPVGFKALNGQIYVVEINTKYNWMDAFHTCNLHGGQLLIIDSKEKNDVIIKLLKDKLGKIPQLWLGANDELSSGDKTRNFYWSATGRKMIYSNWGGINPNNNLANEHCASMEPDFFWNDAPCHYEMGFICECFTQDCLEWASC